MSEKLNRANRILDRACKSAGLDPVAVRIAMVNAIKDKQPTLYCRPDLKDDAIKVLEAS